MSSAVILVETREQAIEGLYNVVFTEGEQYNNQNHIYN